MAILFFVSLKKALEMVVVVKVMLSTHHYLFINKLYTPLRHGMLNGLTKYDIIQTQARTHA